LTREGRDPGDLSGSAHLNNVLTARLEAVKMKVSGRYCLADAARWTILEFSYSV
jgi:hypothetical protein